MPYNNTTRRSLLKSTGATIAGLGLFSGAAASQSNTPSASIHVEAASNQGGAYYFVEFVNGDWESGHVPEGETETTFLDSSAPDPKWINGSGNMGLWINYGYCHSNPCTTLNHGPAMDFEVTGDGNYIFGPFYGNELSASNVESRWDSWHIGHTLTGSPTLELTGTNDGVHDAKYDGDEVEVAAGKVSGGSGDYYSVPESTSNSYPPSVFEFDGDVTIDVSYS